MDGDYHNLSPWVFLFFFRFVHAQFFLRISADFIPYPFQIIRKCHFIVAIGQIHLISMGIQVERSEILCWITASIPSMAL